MKRQFKIQFDPNYQGAPPIEFDSTSQTVPDMGLTLQELLINHSRGLPSNVKHYESQYFEDLEIPQIEDLTDIKEARASLKRQEEALSLRVKDELKQSETSLPSKEENPAEALSEADKG